MKLLSTVGCILFATFTSVGLSATADDVFTKIVALKGDWKSADQSVSTYTVAAAGFTVTENYGGMISLYAVDGNSIVLTHYCVAGNQPKLRAVVPETFENVLDFKFESISGYEPSDGGYISAMRLEFIDNTHIKQVWTWHDAATNTDGVMETLLLEKVIQ